MNKNITLTITLIFLFAQLSACSFMQNVHDISHKQTTAYQLSDTVLIKPTDEHKNVLIKVINYTKANDKYIKSQLESSMILKGYNIVDDVKNADAILYIKIKNLSAINKTTAQNIQKYAQYSQISGSNKSGKGDLVQDNSSYTINDGGFSISTGNTTTNHKDEYGFNKLLALDTITGLTLGVIVIVSMALLAPMVPIWGAILAGLAISVVPLSLGFITYTKPYAGFIDITLEERLLEPVITKRSVVSQDGASSLKELYASESTEWISKKSEFVILLQGYRRKRTVHNKFSQAVYTISNEVV